jgi:co-chaperonin GroES (HSP10)
MSNAAISISIEKLSKADDPKKALIDQIGELAIQGYELMEDDVLLATFVRPEKTKGGIIITPKAKEEDRFQGKVGLLLKKGPTAFKYDKSGHHYYEGEPPKIHDWVVYRPSEGWEIALNGVSCRLIRSAMIRGKVRDPETIW